MKQEQGLSSLKYLTANWNPIHLLIYCTMKSCLLSWKLFNQKVKCTVGIWTMLRLLESISAELHSKFQQPLIASLIKMPKTVSEHLLLVLGCYSAQRPLSIICFWTYVSLFSSTITKNAGKGSNSKRHSKTKIQCPAQSVIVPAPFYFGARRFVPKH